MPPKVIPADQMDASVIKRRWEPADTDASPFVDNGDLERAAETEVQPAERRGEEGTGGSSPTPPKLPDANEPPRRATPPRKLKTPTADLPPPREDSAQQPKDRARPPTQTALKKSYDTALEERWGQVSFFGFVAVALNDFCFWLTGTDTTNDKTFRETLEYRQASRNPFDSPIRFFCCCRSHENVSQKVLEKNPSPSP